MGNLSLRDAVKHFDVSRPTLLKALKSGDLSAVKDGQGRWSIDPSEMIRRYPARAADPVKPDATGPGNLPTVDRATSGDLTALRDALAEAERRAAVAEALADERARALDAAERNLSDLRRLLPSPAAPAARRRWWPF